MTFSFLKVQHFEGIVLNVIQTVRVRVEPGVRQLLVGFASNQRLLRIEESRSMRANSYVVNSLIGSALYSGWAALTFISIRNGSSEFWVGTVVFAAATTVPAAYVSLNKEKMDMKGVKCGALAGVFFFIGTVLFMYSIATQSISSVYVFIPGSAIIFYLLTANMAQHRGTEKLRVLVGMLIASAGLILGEFIGGYTSFNEVGLVVGILITFSYGLASYYVVLGSTYGIGSIGLSTMMTELILFVSAALFTFDGRLITSASSNYFALLAGLFVAGGFMLEVHLFRTAIRNRVKSLANLNLINVLINGDSIFVMLAAVLLNSYTALSLLGLFLVYVGATIMQLEH